MNDFLAILGVGDAGLGKVGLRLEFQDNEQLFTYLNQNQELKEFVKVPNSKNPSANIKALKEHLQTSHKSEFDNEAAGVVMVPLNQIFTDHKNFQNRETEFSNESVERILSAIREGTFRWAVFDPITLYRNPTDSKLYILSGHSRFTAFKLAAQSGLVVATRRFDQIPAKIFEGTLDEARELARTSNNLSTRETDQERANYYRNKRAEGVTPKLITDEAKKLEGKNANFIVNLSYLNPAGKAWENLKLIAAGTESENARTMKEIADWCGEARRKFPQLTHGHENEIFDWLFSGAFHKLKTKRQYLERLGMAVVKATQFGTMDERLNIENRSGKSASELEYDEKVELARAEYNEAEKQLREKRKEFIARGAEENKIESYLVEYQAAVNNSLRRLNELIKLRESVKEGAKNQMSLFGLGMIQPFNFIGVLGGLPGSGLGAIGSGHLTSGDLYFSKAELDNMAKLKISKAEVEEIFEGRVKSHVREVNRRYTPGLFSFEGMSSKRRFVGYFAIPADIDGKTKILIQDCYYMDFSQIAAQIHKMR